MPQNITDVLTYTTPVQSVADGDGATGANFLLGPQALANRTAYLNNLTTNPAAGITAIRNVANAAALNAIVSPVNGSVALVPGIGLYVYNSSSSATVDNFLVVNGPGGVGRWLVEFQAIANTTPGTAVVSSAGRIPSAIVPNAVIAVVSATQSSAQTIAASTSALTDVTGVTVNVTVAVGDILVVDAVVPIINSSSTLSTSGGLAIVSNIAAPGTGTYAAGTDGTAYSYMGNTSTTGFPFVTVPLVQRLVCGSAGSVTVKLQANNSATTPAYVIGNASSYLGIPIWAAIRVQQIRP